jgi:hypothetical protein
MALNETTHAGGFILSEANGNRSRAGAKLNSGQDLAAGTVVGQLKTAAGAKVSGTGDGTVGAVTLGPDAEVGIYVLTGKTESSNAGTFSVRTPSGQQLPDLTVAVAYASTHINLTVADGANDWDIGDIIHVTVTGGDYEQLDPTATDGTQHAAAILYAGIDASSADTLAAFIVRDAEVNANELVWPDAITAGQKAVATNQLNARGIFLR